MKIKEEYSPEEFKSLPLSKVSENVGMCIDDLTEIQKKVNSAVQKAAKAKESSQAAKAVTLAWYKIGDKAEAIEALQSAMVDVSDVQSDQSDAIKLLLEYQKNVAGGMKFLFALGASNMAANRTVVREVEMRLKNASEEEIGEMARNELRAVMAQLKAQLDFQERQEKLVAEHRTVKETARSNQESIANLRAREAEQDKVLQEKARVDAEQNAELKRQANKDKEHDEKIAANRHNIDENAHLIALIKETLVNHRREIAGVKVSSGSSKLSLALSVTALIAAIISLVMTLLR